MATRLIIDIDTSGDETIQVALASASKNGISADEKILAGKIVETMAKAKGFPKISSLDTNSSDKQ